MPDTREFNFHTSVDDELYDDLVQFAGHTVVHSAVWEDSLADALAGSSEAETDADNPLHSAASFDIDLYLSDGLYFELYGVTLFTDLEGEPLAGAVTVESHLNDLVRSGGVLSEVAVDEEESLVLVLSLGGVVALYLSVGGFVLEEWDELPV